MTTSLRREVVPTLRPRRERRPWIRVALIALVIVLALATLVVWAARRYLSSAALERRLVEGVHAASDGLYRLRLNGVRYDPLARTLVARGVSLEPDPAGVARRSEAGRAPRTRVRFSAASVRLDGLGLPALMRGEVRIAAAEVERPRVRIHLDDRLPRDPRPRVSRLPHESFRTLRRPLRIDTVRVRDGSVHYSERARDGAQPGRIRFEEVWATLYNLTNDPARMSARTPAELDLRMLLAGRGRTELSLDYDLLGSGLDFAYRGEIGRMDATAFNEILVDLEGIVVKRGVLDGARFDFDVRNGTATGTVEVRYRDLAIEFVDKATREQDLGHWFQSVLANHLELRDRNPPAEGMPPDRAEVRRTREPRDHFVRFLWENVRHGLLTTLGFV